MEIYPGFFLAKYYGLLNYLDRQISRNLYESNIVTRTANQNGLWCCALIPSVLIFYTLLHKVSKVYSLVAFVSIGVLFYCLLFVIFMSVSCLVLREPIYGGCLASSLVSALLLYTYLQQDLTVSLLFSILTIIAFSLLLRVCVMEFQKTFTIGEAMVVSQSIVLYGTMTVAKAFWEVEKADAELEFINHIVNTVLSTVGLIVTVLYVMPDEMKDLYHLGYVVSGAIMIALIMLHCTLGTDCLLRIANYIFFDKNRVQLILWWLFLVLIAVCVLSVRTKLAVKATTVTRKSFHLLASGVFLTGIIYDRYLMMLAAGIGLGLIVLVEMLRKNGIEPISSALQSAFLVYSDEKDCGAFAMTPVYLYCGLACPLLLARDDRLELLSGVLAVGVGDTAASWFGSRYGFNKWPDSQKSLEGTAFNILSQLSTVYALDLFDLLNVEHALFRTAIAATISGLVEAKTEQVDNLVLPLVTLLAFQFTKLLC